MKALKDILFTFQFDGDDDNDDDEYDEDDDDEWFIYSPRRGGIRFQMLQILEKFSIFVKRFMFTWKKFKTNSTFF